MDGTRDTVEVDVKALSGYSKILADKQSHAAEIKGLVGRSDVTSESWGVVGCFLKPRYEQLLAELLGLLDDMKEGLGSAPAKGVPVAGGAIKAVDGVVDDGRITGSDTRGFIADSATFIQSCSDAVRGFVQDPIGALVGQGLNFLFTLIQPLQDMLHAVSGDGPALGNAAGNFTAIGKGLGKFAEDFTAEAKEKLDTWRGDASKAAHERLGGFARGVRGIADESGNIAQLLQGSSMIMTVIEDFIKALLTEFVSFLIWIWPPALASAVVSFGASTAAAMGISVGRGAQVTTRATGQVNRLRRLLNMLKDLLAEIKELLRKYKPLLHESTGAIGKREARGFVGSMADAGLDSLKGQVLPGKMGSGDAERRTGPGKIPGHVNNAGKIVDAGMIGEDQSAAQTREDLDF